MPYSYIDFGTLKSALLQRLQDTYTGYTSTTGSGFVSPTEAGAYLQEALHTLNALAALWNADYVLSFSSGDTWKSLNVPGSPRQRTVTDTDLYNLIEYHLLEPATGGTWTGTTQFNITGISEALQYRRDEMMQVSGANTFNLTGMASPTSTNRTTLPDNVLDLRRVRWIPISGSPYPLFREDAPAFDDYGVQDILNVGDPDSYALTTNQPLQFDCNAIPPIPGQWDLLAVCSAVNPLAPPASTVMELPDDWCWVAKWGALADLMTNSPEGADRLRAKYAIQRYERGKKAMLALPWLVRASVTRIPTDCPPYEEADAYKPNWEQTWLSSDPQIVVGGMDLVAVAPFATVSTGVLSSLLTVVGTAPIPTLDGDKIQLARDGVDAILAYAQHVAMFKLGGMEFTETLPLYEQFEKYCAQENARYAALGINRNLMILQGSANQDIDPRFQFPKEEKQQPEEANA